MPASETMPKIANSSRPQTQTVAVENFFNQYKESLNLRLVAGERGLKRRIREPTVNRPGLALAGFTKYFASKRIQVIGSAESTFLRTVANAEKPERYASLFSHRFPCVVFSRNINPDRYFIEAAEKFNVPVFKSPLITMKFINKATLALDMMFAPKTTIMGSMVDILGIGVVIQGESGIGKSESVLALIERGYSLVADDVTRVTLVDGTQAMGTSPELTRNHMEVRGIGIINVGAMFGVKSIRKEKRIDLVVQLHLWQDVPDVDRLGMEQEFVEVLGIKIPLMTIPVRPGRDLARLIEVAAFQTKLRISGYNAAKVLDDRLIAYMTGQVGP